MIDYCVEPIIKYDSLPVLEIHKEVTFDFGYRALFKDENDYFLFLLERKNCISINKEPILKFIKNNSKVKSDIFDILDKIYDYFSVNQKTSLELFIDDEESSTKGELFVNIIKGEYRENDIDTFDIINNWFIENIYKYRQNININIDFE